VQVVGDGVVRLGGQDEVGGDQLGALVDELEEGVLSIRARLAKQNRTCSFSMRFEEAASDEKLTRSVLDRGAVRGNRLSVGLHRQLLQVGRETVEVLIESNVHIPH
jgi:hypothetical protein